MTGCGVRPGDYFCDVFNLPSEKTASLDIECSSLTESSVIGESLCLIIYTLF